jgi:OCT family organic cation transporter-like MFS transporter 18
MYLAKPIIFLFLFLGVMLGLNMAVNSLIRSLSPTIGGYLLHYFGFPVFGYLGFTMLSFVTVLLFIKYRQ